MRTSFGVELKEVEANWFAATLLMPAHGQGAGGGEGRRRAIHDAHVERLPREFKVSQQAMTIRLSALGLL